MNYIINPFTKEKIEIKSKNGQRLLKLYSKQYLKSNKNIFCPICLNKIDLQKGGNDLRESIECKHLYHSDCLKKWGENKSCLQCNNDKIPIYMNYEN